MLSTSANFDAIHDLLYKKPVYIVHFDSETVDYCNHTPGSPDNTIKLYLIDIQGHGQTVTPEEGKSSIGSTKIQLLDVDDELTALWATDTSSYFHRRKTTIKAGYKGLDEADFATIQNAGRVTGMKLSADGLAWILDITDPRKYEQERIFLGSEDSTFTMQGNPIDILLSIYLSSDTPGTNHSFYDRYGDGNGLNLTTADVDVTGLEALRDNWFPGNSHYMKFTITERETAGDFITSQIRKALNLRPVLTADGKMTEKPFKPPLATSDDVQSFGEDNIVGLPKYDTNLSALVNRVEFFTDYDGSDYQSQDYYVDATSLLSRGPGKKPITIKSRGLHTSISGSSLNSFTTDVINSRKSSIFGRFKTPPTKITMDTFFTRWLSEAGDIVPFTHSKLPDIVSGTRGFSDQNMEVINRQIKWKDGKVTITLLDTGFAQGTYGVINDLSVDYDSATTAQKKFGFIAQSLNVCALNSCTDPDNDADDTTGWLPYTGSAISSVANGSGEYCLKVEEDGKTYPYAYTVPLISVTTGEYVFSAKVNSGGSEGSAYLWVYDVTNAETMYETIVEAGNNWNTLVEKTLEITARTQQVRLYCYSLCALGSGLFTLFDDVSFSKSTLGSANDDAHLIVP